MRPDQYGILYLALTSRCNLACSYCPVPKAGLSMSRLVAERGVDLLLHGDVRELRFFGGEPLLEFELVKNLVERVEHSGKAHSRLVFRLTTNGLLLDDEKLDFIAAHRNIQLVLSVDGDEQSHTSLRIPSGGAAKGDPAWFEKYATRIAGLERPAIVNMVVCPQNVARLTENFTYILRHGLRRINILPAFYVEWSQAQLMELRAALKKLAALIDRLWRDAFPLEIQNMQVNVDKPLFSGGLLLDCDGGIYPGDIAMLFEPGEGRRRFSLGNVNELADLDKLGGNSIKVDEKALLGRFSAAALASTAQADAELSRFVAALELARKTN